MNKQPEVHMVKIPTPNGELVIKERRANDSLVVTMVQQMLDSHNYLSKQISESTIKIAKMETTLDTQAKAMEKFNNHGQRIYGLENCYAVILKGQEDIQANCIGIQAQKAKIKDEEEKAALAAKIRKTPPWPLIITGSIVGIILIAVNVFVDLVLLK
jgi:uncharacterized membrane protein